MHFSNNYFVDQCECVAQCFYFPGRLDEAFSHCAAVLKTKAFKESLEWVACCVEIFEVRAVKSLFETEIDLISYGLRDY